MISNRERRLADLFYADLMGLARPAATSNRVSAEEDAGKPNPRSGRVVFYDDHTLRYLDGWTRDTGSDDVYLVTRRLYDPIRESGRRRGNAYSDYLRRAVRGQRDLMTPHYVSDPSLFTAPLTRGAPYDFDDLMIDELIKEGRRLAIQSEADQWKLISKLLDLATKAAQAAGRNRVGQEFVAFFVLDIPKATLRLVQATNVTMVGDHADIKFFHATFSDGLKVAILNRDDGERVIGDIHTHALLDPDITSTAIGMRTGARLIHGVSEIDVASAKAERFPVYAIDSRFVHRANPTSRQNDSLSKVKDKGNILRDALRIFGGEPAPI
jgi:hypothetical protein